MAATTGTAPAREAVGSADRAGPELHLQLDYPLPERLAVGAGTALFVCGWCFSPHDRVSSLSLVLDGEAQPVMAELMPRGDVFRALHPAVDPYGTQGLSADPDSEEDPELRSFRSGFWGLVRVPPRPAGAELDLRLRAVLDGGGETEAEVARITVDEGSARPVEIDPPEPAAGPFVAVCMATFNPPPELFRRQLDSIRAQTHRNWVCVISDDCSSPESFAALEEAVADDPRFVVSRSPERLHFYRNFERALEPGARRRGLRGHGRPGRRLAPGQARDAAGRDRRRAARLQRRAHHRPRGRADLGHLLEHPPPQPRQPPVAADGQLGDRRGVAVPARPAGLRAALPAAPVLPLPRSLDRSGGAGAGQRGLRRAPSVRLRAARQRGPGTCRGELDAAVAHSAQLAERRTRGSGSAAGGCTTSWTAAGSCSSPRSWRCAAARR